MTRRTAREMAQDRLADDSYVVLGGSPTLDVDCEFIAASRSAVPALVAALWEARETNARLNRRAQIAEAAIADLTREPVGGRKHRAVAAEVWERCEESHGLACRTTREAWAEVRRLRGRLLSDEPPMAWCAVCGRPIWEGDRLCCGTRNGAPVGSAAAAETGSAPFPHSDTPATVEAVSVAHSDGE